ncbi:hypothetical protein HG530_012305 [Fusarium avenaceum]|nr:hypothetical protein HG530_012305 [Fusarium avenaceum]
MGESYKLYIMEDKAYKLLSSRANTLHLPISIKFLVLHSRVEEANSIPQALNICNTVCIHFLDINVSKSNIKAVLPILREVSHYIDAHFSKLLLSLHTAVHRDSRVIYPMQQIYRRKFGEIAE